MRRHTWGETGGSARHAFLQGMVCIIPCKNVTLQRRLTITIADEVCRRLPQQIERGEISGFIEGLDRPHVVPPTNGGPGTGRRRRTPLPSTKRWGGSRRTRTERSTEAPGRGVLGREPQDGLPQAGIATAAHHEMIEHLDIDQRPGLYQGERGREILRAGRRVADGWLWATIRAVALCRTALRNTPPARIDTGLTLPP
jgi:hypothetical protein